MTVGECVRPEGPAHPNPSLTLPPPEPKSLAMTDSAALADLSFEDALKQLETIVRQLESGEVPLDESISLYAKGDALKRLCEERLNAAKARIEKISLGADGAPRGTEPFTAS